MVEKELHALSSKSKSEVVKNKPWKLNPPITDVLKSYMTQFLLSPIKITAVLFFLA